MENAPFSIKKLTLDSAGMRVRLRKAGTSRLNTESANAGFPAYLVTSTAPHNIDEIPTPTTRQALAEVKAGIEAIARDLHRIQTDPTITEPPELVLAVHGYNTQESGIRAWYSDMYRYIARDDAAIRQRRNLVFVGYRWSSERLSFRPRNLWRNLRALPQAPQGMLAIASTLLVSYLLSSLIHGSMALQQLLPIWLIEISLFLALSLTVMILTLLVLRITVYFRDVYRAINFAVPDLTELVRQIDQAVINLRVEDICHNCTSPTVALEKVLKEARKADHRAPAAIQKIKLNFLGHSMGGLVITRVVRVLSDVFDRRSIAQTPIADIGHTLSLGRLILASPDIPVLSIISSRANGLSSSLRRFDEAYLFSNEGDLALRLASTAANYISFPSARQSHGHRLGSIALTNSIRRKGIINLDYLREHYPIETNLKEAILADPLDILQCLFITHSSGKQGGYLSLARLFSLEHREKAKVTLSDLFTFFDCTDYKDYKLKLDQNGRRERSLRPTGLLTRAKNKPHLRLWNYLELIFDSVFGRRDVHGGYFHGEYSRQLIYRIAFLGFAGTLKATQAEHPVPIGLEQSETASEIALDRLNQLWQEKGIQVYLSPLRYRSDVQGVDVYTAKEELLKTVREEQPMLETAQSSIPQSVPLAS